MQSISCQVEEARAYSNLGSSHHYRRNFTQAIIHHENVLKIAQELGDQAIAARAYAGLGHASRCAGDYQQVPTRIKLVLKNEEIVIYFVQS